MLQGQPLSDALAALVAALSGVSTADVLITERRLRTIGGERPQADTTTKATDLSLEVLGGVGARAALEGLLGHKPDHEECTKLVFLMTESLREAGRQPELESALDLLKIQPGTSATQSLASALADATDLKGDSGALIRVYDGRFWRKTPLEGFNALAPNWWAEKVRAGAFGPDDVEQTAAALIDAYPPDNAYKARAVQKRARLLRAFRAGAALVKAAPAASEDEAANNHLGLPTWVWKFLADTATETALETIGRAQGYKAKAAATSDIDSAMIAPKFDLAQWAAKKIRDKRAREEDADTDRPFKQTRSELAGPTAPQAIGAILRNNFREGRGNKGGGNSGGNNGRFGNHNGGNGGGGNNGRF